MADHRIRVLIVDDSVVVRLMLQQVIREDPLLEIDGAESSGQAALDKLDALRPDVVILDVEMPGMNGVETVAELRARAPRLPVIMFSSHTEDGAAVTIEALSRGASDFVMKPSQTASADTAMTLVREQLLSKIKAFGNIRRRPYSEATPAPADSSSVKIPLKRSVIEIVCFAASTGGPEALELVLTALPANFPVPIAIVQHMPPFFTKQLARRLGEKCAIRVREAQSGETLEPGTALIAPGDFHLQVRRRDTRCYAITNAGPPENSCRPAADVLFRSAATDFGNQALVVVMTGMGQDGLKGCEAVWNAGGRVVIQDEATSVIWGMAGAVSRAGFASKILPIDKIAADILRRVQEGRL
ncbi:MAG: chemotaxis response regulator protein-glutamate methylesterase [Planctomycetales bacterium]|nr:chemotaxis response regulator protein-glutamate methylesterase [Planctomycetales bacterium]